MAKLPGLPSPTTAIFIYPLAQYYMYIASVLSSTQRQKCFAPCLHWSQPGEWLLYQCRGNLILFGLLATRVLCLTSQPRKGSHSKILWNFWIPLSWEWKNRLFLSPSKHLGLGLQVVTSMIWTRSLKDRKFPLKTGEFLQCKVNAAFKFFSHLGLVDIIVVICRFIPAFVTGIVSFLTILFSCQVSCKFSRLLAYALVV